MENMIQRRINQTIACERIKIFKQIEEAIDDVESGRASAFDSLCILMAIATEDMIVAAENAGMVK